MIRALLFLTALILGCWAILAGLVVGLYFLAIHLPGVAFFLALVLLFVGGVVFLEGRHDVHHR